MKEKEFIRIENIGPISELEIPLHEDGGVIVLTGPNGAGKDIAIKAVRQALGSKERLTKKDGSKSGSLEMPGVTLKVTANVRRTGEAEVVAISGDLDYAEFVNPVKKDPVAADKDRIKLLCKIHGVEADRSKFESLMPADDFDKIASAKTLGAATIDEMAQALKTDLEAAARKRENEAKVLEGKALACEEAAAGIDLDAEYDSGQLQKAYEAALHAATIAEEQHEAAIAARERLEKAKESLELAKGQYAGPPVEDVRAELQEAQKAADHALAEVDALSKQLLAARNKAREKASELDWAKERLRAAEQNASLIASTEKTISQSASVFDPGEEAVAAANQAVTQAKEALERGALIRDAIRKREEGANYRLDAKQALEEAGNLRDAARGTLDVLSGALSAGVLFIEPDENGNPRFCYDHPKRGVVFYHDLSVGEKWIIAMADAVDQCRKRGIGTAVLPMEQTSWEGLDGRNQRALAEACRAAKVNLITAAASKGADDTEITIQEYAEA